MRIVAGITKNQTPDTCHLPPMPTATPKDPPPAIYPTICSTLVLSWGTSLFTQITKFKFSDALFDTLALQIINWIDLGGWLDKKNQFFWVILRFYSIVGRGQALWLKQFLKILLHTYFAHDILLHNFFCFFWGGGHSQ